MIFLILVSLAAIGFLAAFITGMTRYDLKNIMIERDIRRHPYAKRWRKRPTIVARTASGEIDELLSVIKASGYRKVKPFSPTGPSDHMTLIAARTPNSFAPQSILNAIYYLEADSSLQSIEIITPENPSSTSLRELLKFYHRLANVFFVHARTGLKVSSTGPMWPVLMRHAHLSYSPRVLTYAIASWIIKTIHLHVAIFITYLALALHQAEFLAAYLACFLLWILFSLAQYKYLSLRQKIGYFLLSPVSFIYFAYRLFSAPFRIRSVIRAFLTYRQSAMLKV